MSYLPDENDDRACLNFYDLERYLFEDVNRRFHGKGYLEAFDFFAIVIWKANRAKSKIAKKLTQGQGGLDQSVITLTKDLYASKSATDRLRLLIEKYRFRLPMASAILTVLWPDEFTVYDVRVCQSLKKLCREEFRLLVNRTNFEDVWDGYSRYRKAVEEAVPAVSKLRDKDRVLWGRSAIIDHRTFVTT